MKSPSHSQKLAPCDFLVFSKVSRFKTAKDAMGKETEYEYSPSLILAENAFEFCFKSEKIEWKNSGIVRGIYSKWIRAKG